MLPGVRDEGSATDFAATFLAVVFSSFSKARLLISSLTEGSGTEDKRENT